MQVSVQFQTGRDHPKIRLYRRSQLRKVNLILEEERQRKEKLAKLARKRYDREYEIAQQIIREAEEREVA